MTHLLQIYLWGVEDVNTHIAFSIDSSVTLAFLMDTLAGNNDDSRNRWTCKFMARYNDNSVNKIW